MLRALSSTRNTAEFIARVSAGERDFQGMSLVGATLQSAALGSINLEFAHLRGANLHGADLRGAKLDRADLQMADLAKTGLDECSLVGADLRGVNLKGASLVDANVVGATLRGAELSGAMLRGAKLSRTDLSRADLRLVDLSEANLRGAHLQGADLSGANLRGAGLRTAGLQGADLRGADLRDADLRGSVFSDTRLDDAQFAGAIIGETVFADVDLRRAKGLDALNHAAPSTIGTDTFARSQGFLPESFLVGCGLRPWEIRTARAYDRALSAEALSASLADVRAMDPSRHPRVLISHSDADLSFVTELQQRIKNLGFFSWTAPHEAKGVFREKHSRLGITHDVALVLVLSKHSVRSEWVEHEAKLARKLEAVGNGPALFPVTLDESWSALREPGRVFESVPESSVISFVNWTESTVFDKSALKLVSAISDPLS